MQTPRSLRLPRSARPRSVRRAHAAATLTLSFALVVALASCDEKAPTGTDEPASRAGTGVAGDEADVAALVAQGDVGIQAIALPVNQNVATTAPAPAFRINQTGSGPNGIFRISASTNTQAALQGVTSGGGLAGVFRIQNPANTEPALQARTNGSGFAVQGVATGTGGAGSFQINDASNSNTALTVSTNGLGSAGLFEVSNADNNTRNALEVRTNGLEGTAISALSTGPGGFAGVFRNTGSSGDGLSVSAPRIALDVDGRSQLSGDVSISGDFRVGTAFEPRNSVFNGNVTVTGTLTKPAGSFRIDHPLDPEHRYLSHSFVESPDMMNVYNGNTTLDASGRASVELPEYFEALNRDFRYQLTAIGAPGPNLYIAEGVKENRFRIAGGRAYAHVSWQVTGVRQDAYANAHRIQVEEEKPPADPGLVARR